MPLAPLWSRLVSPAVTTNAAVESHTRAVKKQLLHGQTRLRPGDFCRVLLKDMAAGVEADMVPSACPQGQKCMLAECPLTHPEVQEECCARREPNGNRPTWYASTRPLNICVPASPVPACYLENPPCYLEPPPGSRAGGGLHFQCREHQRRGLQRRGLQSSTAGSSG